MDFLIHALEKDLLKKYIQNFVQLSKNNIVDEYWIEDNFLVDLNKKWELSCYVTDSLEKITGFLIASEKEESVHIHKFVVDAPVQGKGLGARMLTYLQNRIHKPITLKVHKENEMAIGFYARNGFTIQDERGDLYTMIKSL